MIFNINSTRGHTGSLLVYEMIAIVHPMSKPTEYRETQQGLNQLFIQRDNHI